MRDVGFVFFEVFELYYFVFENEGVIGCYLFNKEFFDFIEDMFVVFDWCVLVVCFGFY